MFRSIAFLSLCLVSVTAHAAGRPMIEVGAGAVGSGSGDMSVLLKVAAHGTTLEAGDEFAGILLARFKGELAVGAVPGQFGEVPYFEIEFVPLTVGIFERGSITPGVFGAGLHALPLHVSRDVSVDREVTVRSTAIGFSFEGSPNEEDGRRIAAYVKVAVDALGYKAAKFVTENRDTFHGFSIGAINAEFGMVASPLSRSFKVLVALGAGGDVAIGTGGHQTDGRVYAEVRSEIREFVQLFLRASINGADSADFDMITERRLMAGVGFIF